MVAECCGRRPAHPAQFRESDQRRGLDHGRSPDPVWSNGGATGVAGDGRGLRRDLRGRQGTLNHAETNLKPKAKLVGEERTRSRSVRRRRPAHPLRVRRADQEPPMRLPPSTQDCVPQDHLVYFVIDGSSSSICATPGTAAARNYGTVHLAPRTALGPPRRCSPRYPPVAARRKCFAFA